MSEQGAQLGSLKAGSSGDGVALAESEGEVATLESKLHGMEHQLLEAVAEAGAAKHVHVEALEE